MKFLIAVGGIALIAFCVQPYPLDAQISLRDLETAARTLYGGQQHELVFVDPDNTNESRDQIRLAKSGQSGEGVILQEKGDQLALDVSPCDRRVAIFTKPYHKEKIRSKDCSGRSVDIYEVTQESK